MYVPCTTLCSEEIEEPRYQAIIRKKKKHKIKGFVDRTLQSDHILFIIYNHVCAVRSLLFLNYQLFYDIISAKYFACFIDMWVSGVMVPFLLFLKRMK